MDRAKCRRRHRGQQLFYDAVYLSRDQFFDREADTYLGYVYHIGGLASGESYTVTQSFNIASGLSGSFYVSLLRTAETEFRKPTS